MARILDEYTVIHDMAQKVVDDVKQLISDTYGVSLERLAELAQAEVDGRCLILPCKVGDTLFITESRFYNYERHEGVQQGICKGYEFSDRCEWVVKVDLEYGEPHTQYFYSFYKFGKTVFLTRAEAEAALKEGV